MTTTRRPASRRVWSAAMGCPGPRDGRCPSSRRCPDDHIDTRALGLEHIDVDLLPRWLDLQRRRRAARIPEPATPPSERRDVRGVGHGSGHDAGHRPAHQVAPGGSRRRITRSNRRQLPFRVPRHHAVTPRSCGFAAGRRGVCRRPHRQLLSRERHEVLLEHRRLCAEPEMLVEPAVHRRTAHVVVVVAELEKRKQLHLVACPEQLVVLLQLREAVGRHRPGPVVGGGHPEGARREQRRELHVAGADAQVVGVLAGAPALHARRHHHGRERHGGPVVDGASRKVCVPPPLAPVTATRAGSTSSSDVEEVQRPDGVPHLQAQDRLELQLRAEAEEQPLVGARARASSRAVRDGLRNLNAVGVALHVVEEHHRAHPRELHGTRLEQIARAVVEALGARRQLLPALCLGDVLEAAAGPVAVRGQARRAASRCVPWACTSCRSRNGRAGSRRRPARRCTRRARRRRAPRRSTACASATATAPVPRALVVATPWRVPATRPSTRWARRGSGCRGRAAPPGAGPAVRPAHVTERRPELQCGHCGAHDHDDRQPKADVRHAGASC